MVPNGLKLTFTDNRQLDDCYARVRTMVSVFKLIQLKNSWAKHSVQSVKYQWMPSHY